MRVAVIGAGSWGTALAVHACRAGHQVTLWAREPEVVEGIQKTGHNPLFLTEVPLPPELKATNALGEAIDEAEVIFFVVPVQFARGVLQHLRAYFPQTAVLISASKGIEVATLSRVDQVVLEELNLTPDRFVVLSGPTFAKEVAAGLPAAAVLAGNRRAPLKHLQHAFSTPLFRLYRCSDVVGVELAGALKNVVAIAAGIATGLGLGHNAIAALLTRGLHEIARLGVLLGGKPETFRGLAGMGDLVLTCTGALSRNRAVGERLGRGEPLEKVLAGREVAEGVPTARAAAELARRHGVEMPITFAVEKILSGNLAPADAVFALMTRSLKDETKP